MTVQQWRHKVTDLSDNSVHKFVGGPEALEETLKFIEQLKSYEWESDKVEICPTCAREL